MKEEWVPIKFPENMEEMHLIRRPSFDSLFLHGD
jgi:hypothetical protein